MWLKQNKIFYLNLRSLNFRFYCILSLEFLLEIFGKAFINNVQVYLFFSRCFSLRVLYNWKKINTCSVYIWFFSRQHFPYLWETSLRASSPGCSGGGAGRLRLWNLNSTSNSPVAPRWLSFFQIFAYQREAETRANVNKYRKIRA